MTAPAILLIEDSAADAALIRAAVAPVVAGDQLVICSDGVAALDYLQCRGSHAQRNPAELPRLVVLDLNLPRLPGLDVLRAIRAGENTRLVPVIVLSGTGRPEDIRQALQLGANSYVRKPADATELARRIALLARYWVELNIAPPILATPP